MGTFKKTNETRQTTYEYVSDKLRVEGSYSRNGQTGMLQSITGTAERYDPTTGHSGEHVGSFNGYPRSGGMVYSLSEMSHQDAQEVWNTIDAIEEQVLSDEDAAADSEQ